MVNRLLTEEQIDSLREDKVFYKEAFEKFREKGLVLPEDISEEDLEILANSEPVRLVDLTNLTKEVK